MKNLKLNTIIRSLQPLLNKLKRYNALLFVLVVVGVYGFLVYRINNLSRVEPTDDAISEKLQTVKRPRIDQSAIDKINQLQGQNVEVQSLFDEARKNPFNE